MLAYILTAIAGLALGIVAMRIWQGAAIGVPGAAAAAPGTGDGPADPTGAPVATGLLARVRAFRPTSLHLLGVAGLVLLAAFGVFALRGGDQPGSSALDSLTLGVAEPDGQSLDDVDTMITRLAARLEANPDDGEGFRMLGWSYLMTGKPQDALAPFERALQLLPDDARVHSGYGEALTAIAENRVTPEARAAFERALELDAAEPRARYFLALWQDQNGQSREALETWLDLAGSAPADATWQADLRREIDRVSAELGVDVSDRLPASPAMPVLDPGTIAAANQLPGEGRQQMIQGMVDGLAARLQAIPNDPDGWMRLLRSRMVLEQRDQAGRDLATARRALSGNSSGLAQVEQVASQLGVPGA